MVLARSIVCDRTGYNLVMNSTVAKRLIELNREFYTRFGDSFSATRQRIQPGVRRVLEILNGDENILDLGCGNGWLARELAERGHRGLYLGLDFSLPLLHDAESLPKNFPATFKEMDLTRLSSFSDQVLMNESWSLITAFAVLHHIPSRELQMNILQTIHHLLKPGGLFIHSNWQFLNSEKLKSRIQNWLKAGLSSNDVDPNDYLLDWRSGGNGLRYVHHFGEHELQELAGATGFHVTETYYSDGDGGRLGLYQFWEVIP